MLRRRPVTFHAEGGAVRAEGAGRVHSRANRLLECAGIQQVENGNLHGFGDPRHLLAGTLQSVAFAAQRGVLVAQALDDITLQIAYTALSKSLRQQQRQKLAVARKLVAMKADVCLHRLSGCFRWGSGFGAIVHDTRANASLTTIRMEPIDPSGTSPENVAMNAPALKP